MPDPQNTLLGKDPALEQIDPAKDYLPELVGEGKKFKDVQSLAKGKAESDLYIRHKEQQFDELRADYLKLKSEHEAVPALQELLDELKSVKARDNDSANPNANNNPDKAAAIDLADLDNRMTNKYLELETTRKFEDNLNKVQSKLVERYGPNYRTQLAQQANDLAMSEVEVDNMARRNPRLFERTFGLDRPVQQETFQAPPRSDRRSDNYSTKDTKRTWAYYQNLKKTDPTSYLSNKTQYQMHQDAIALGDEFKDGDYNAL